MHVTVVSSLDVFCRQQACHALSAGNADALVVFHDLLENGLVVRRIFRPGELIERAESVLEHGCLSCTVRLDLVPTVERLLSRGERHLILGLPPGVASSTVILALRKGLGRNIAIDSAVLACAPDALEDQLWDHHTLFESGFTPIPEDERTSGEFLIAELSFNDTVLLADPDLVPVDPDSRVRGAQLIRELAPHAVVAEAAQGVRPGRHDQAEAAGRATLGSVRIPAAESPSPFTTVLQRARRPLHPERFRHALAALAEGCCWLRGRLWIAAAPGCRIAIQGIGPRVWLENTGPWLADRDPEPSSWPGGHTDAGRADAGYAEACLDWHPEYGDRGTVIAATGEGLDATEVARLLAACELTDEEMAAGFAGLPDPFELNFTR